MNIKGSHISNNLSYIPDSNLALEVLTNLWPTSVQNGYPHVNTSVHNWHRLWELHQNSKPHNGSTDKFHGSSSRLLVPCRIEIGDPAIIIHDPHR